MCMHSLYQALWTHKVSCGSFLCAVYKKNLWLRLLLIGFVALGWVFCLFGWFFAFQWRGALCVCKCIYVHICTFTEANFGTVFWRGASFSVMGGEEKNAANYADLVMKCTIEYNSIFPMLVKVWNWTTCLAPSLPAPNAWSLLQCAPCDASPTSTPSPTSFSHLKVTYSLIVCMSFSIILSFDWGDFAFFLVLFFSPVLRCQTSQSMRSFQCLAATAPHDSKASGLCRQCVRLHSQWTVNAWMVFLTVTEQSCGFVQAISKTSQPTSSSWCLDGTAPCDRAKPWVCAGNVSDFTASEQSLLGWYFSQWQSKALGLSR